MYICATCVISYGCVGGAKYGPMKRVVSGFRSIRFRKWKSGEGALYLIKLHNVTMTLGFMMVKSRARIFYIFSFIYVILFSFFSVKKCKSFSFFSSPKKHDLSFIFGKDLKQILR